MNSAEGLEQGFTLAERPAGDGPLVLELAVAQARAPRCAATESVRDGDGIEARAIAKLAAIDASGRALAAHFELPGRGSRCGSSSTMRRRAIRS